MPIYAKNKVIPNWDEIYDDVEFVRIPKNMPHKQKKLFRMWIRATARGIFSNIHISSSIRVGDTKQLQNGSNRRKKQMTNRAIGKYVKRRQYLRGWTFQPQSDVHISQYGLYGKDLKVS